MHKPKILVLTLRIGGNYGGMVQAYALQTYLKSLGLDVATTSMKAPGTIRSILRYGYFALKRIRNRFQPGYFSISPDLEDIRTVHTRKFVEKHIVTVDGAMVTDETFAEHLEAIVVGSDQVWRHDYVSIPTYLLSFASEWDITRISYAASFGRDDLEGYSPGLVTESARLAQKFDGISVREDSGVALARSEWGVAAAHHIDPTLLLEVSEYQRLIDEDEKILQPSEGELFSYVLDKGTDQATIVDMIATRLGYREFTTLVANAKSRSDFLDNISSFQLKPLTQWLKSFADAKYVVTDSFHGTVFSILFHKPFVTIGNEGRGLARFESLLRMFELEDRLVTNSSQIDDVLLSAEIDWKKVELIRADQIERSRNYLTEHLVHSAN